MHSVDGLGLKYAGRTSRKAQRYNAGLLLDVVPVAWTKDWHKDRDTGETFLRVGYRDAAEMVTCSTSSEPFVIALAAAKDDAATPPVFDEFRGVFEVAPTGKQLGPDSLEARVIRRLKAV